RRERRLIMPGDDDKCGRDPPMGERDAGQRWSRDRARHARDNVERHAGLPNCATLVVLMGVGRSVALATTLIDRGWPCATPAAIIVNASAADQQVWRGTLDQLARAPVEVSSH